MTTEKLYLFDAIAVAFL